MDFDMDVFFSSDFNFDVIVGSVNNLFGIFNGQISDLDQRVTALEQANNS